MGSNSQTTQKTQATPPSNPQTSDDDLPPLDVNSIDWKEAPLDTVLGLNGAVLVHEMTHEQLIAYVKRSNELRSSAQAKNKALRKESEEVHGIVKEKKTKTKKDVSADTIALAMKLLLGESK